MRFLFYLFLLLINAAPSVFCMEGIQGGTTSLSCSEIRQIVKKYNDLEKDKYLICNWLEANQRQQNKSLKNLVHTILRTTYLIVRDQKDPFTAYEHHKEEDIEYMKEKRAQYYEKYEKEHESSYEEYNRIKNKISNDSHANKELSLWNLFSQARRCYLYFFDNTLEGAIKKVIQHTPLSNYIPHEQAYQDRLYLLKLIIKRTNKLHSNPNELFKICISEELVPLPILIDAIKSQKLASKRNNNVHHSDDFYDNLIHKSLHEVGIKTALESFDADVLSYLIFELKIDPPFELKKDTHELLDESCAKIIENTQLINGESIIDTVMHHSDSNAIKYLLNSAETKKYKRTFLALQKQQLKEQIAAKDAELKRKKEALKLSYVRELEQQDEILQFLYNQRTMFAGYGDEKGLLTIRPTVIYSEEYKQLLEYLNDLADSPTTLDEDQRDNVRIFIKEMYQDFADALSKYFWSLPEKELESSTSEAERKELLLHQLELLKKANLLSDQLRLFR